MSVNTIITIGRQTGSGGKEVGRHVAEMLGIPYYDREILDRAAEESGFSKEIIARHDEKRVGSLLYSIVTDSPAAGLRSVMPEMPLDHQFFLAQFNSIRGFAKEGGCVLVGRCADYALEGDPHLLTLFFHADINLRAERVAEELGLSLAKAKEHVIKTDKHRSSYYSYFTGKKWGDAANYDFSINPLTFGIEETAEIICKMAELKDKATHNV